MSFTFCFLLFSFLFLMWTVQSVILVENQDTEEGQQTWTTLITHSLQVQLPLRLLVIQSQKQHTLEWWQLSMSSHIRSMSLNFLCADFFSSSRFFF